MILEIIFFVACVRLLGYTGRPFLCAGIYLSLTVISALLFGAGFSELAVGAVISSLLFSAYFWLLDRYEDSFGIYSLILVVGLLLILLRASFIAAILPATE